MADSPIADSTIEVTNLGKIYGSTKAIDDVHFSVKAGEIMGFLGPNGAGKTTTMRILAGYLPATTGTAKVAGYDVHRHSMQVRRRIGYLPETPPLYPNMTVKSFLAFVAKIKGIKAKQRRRQVHNAMSRCQLVSQENTPIKKLSKGYRQRVGIAQAIVHQPPVIILDEPTVGLDPRQIIEVRNLIKSLAGEHTIMLSTHILPEASMICDRVTIINHGQIITTNTPADLQTQLTSHAGYELEIRGELSSIQPALAQLPGIIEVSPIAKAPDAPGHWLKVTYDSPQEVGAELAALIVNQGWQLLEMRRTRPTLEDVFLELTTEDPLMIDQDGSS